MPQQEMIALARDRAKVWGLSPDLVCAVCEQETGNRCPDPRTGQEAWNPWAIRYEDAFYHRYILPLLDHGELRDITEARARSFSWGLMQVMGQTARESGFAGNMAQLCDPAVGLETGCRVLAKKLAEAQGDIVRGLLFWNGGSDTTYPTSVLARMAKYEND
jgi:hypothetical protein